MGNILAVIKTVKPTKQLTDLLIRFGYDAVFAKTHKQILEAVEKENIDLVILDFTMPNEEGFSLCEKILDVEALNTLPMIGLVDEFTEKEACFDAGVTDIIDKYYLDESMIAKIRVYKELSEAKATAKSAELSLEKVNSEFEALNRRVELVAIQDSLTNLYTRKFTMEQLEIAISRYDRAGVGFSIIIGDIDNFKKVNDTYGPAFGDEVLMGISQILKYHSRVQDIVSRWGGEEFLMVLPDTNLEGANIYAERARKRIEEKTFMNGESEVSVTMTFGVVTYNHVMPLNMILSLVDDALFTGKNNGKNRVITAEI